MTRAAQASSDDRRIGIIYEIYGRCRAPVTKALESGKNVFLGTFLRIQSTLGRICAIAAGTIIMGPIEFLSFYFVHMFLRSLTVLFCFDSDVEVTQTIRKHQKIGMGHFAFLLACNAILSIPMLVFYLVVINVFDRFVTPGFINLDFAYFYSLVILGSVLQTFYGAIRARQNVWLKALVLRGSNVLALILIIPFVLLGIDHQHLPYVWVCSAAISLILTIGVGGPMLASRIDLADWKLPTGRNVGDILQAAADYGAARTRKRAVMIMVRGGVAIILGPFAGMTLSALQLGKRDHRQKVLSKFEDKKLFKNAAKGAKKAKKRTPSFLKWAAANDRPLCFLVIIACGIAVAIYALRDSASAVVLLGMLVAASRMFAISFRILVLTMLGSGRPADVSDEEEEA